MTEGADLAVLTVQALARVRAFAQALQAQGQATSEIDREIRDSMAATAPAIRESLRLEMTSDEIARWL